MINKREIDELIDRSKIFNLAFIDLMQCVNRILHLNLPAEDGKVTVNKIVQPYIGDACPQCAMFMLVQTGTCKTCRGCGWNGGCG